MKDRDDKELLIPVDTKDQDKKMGNGFRTIELVTFIVIGVVKKFWKLCTSMALILLLTFWYYGGLLSLLLLIFALFGSFYNAQDILLYYPEQPPQARLFVEQPSIMNLPFENHHIKTKDGVKINLVLIKNPLSNAPTFIYFHGNAGNIGHRFTLKKDELESFDGTGTMKWEEIAKRCLAKKRETMECFLADLKWAKEGHIKRKQDKDRRPRKKRKSQKIDISRQDDISSQIVRQDDISDQIVRQDDISNQIARQGEISSQIVGQDDISDQIVGHDDISDQIVGQDDISDQIVGQDDISDQIVGQDDISDQIVGQDDISSQIVRQDDVSNQIARQDDISSQIVRQDNVSNQIVRQDDISNQIVQQDDISNQIVRQDDISDQILRQDDISDQIVRQDDISDQIVIQDDISDQIVRQDDISDQILRQDDISDQIVGHDDISDQIVGQDDISDQIVGQDDISDQIVGQDSISDQIVRHDGICDQIVGQDYISDQIVGQDDISDQILRQDDISDHIERVERESDGTKNQQRVLIEDMSCLYSKKTKVHEHDYEGKDQYENQGKRIKDIMMLQKLYPIEYHSSDETSHDDGFVSESEEEAECTEDEYDDSLKDADYIQESDSEGTDVNSDDGSDWESETYEWTPENVGQVLKETEEKSMEVETSTQEKSEESTEDLEDELPCKRDLRDEDCILNEKYPKVFIKGFQRGNTNSKHDRVYDCIHACLFCHELYTNIQSHYERKHMNQQQVKSIKDLKDLKAKEADKDEIEKMNKKLKLEMKMLRNSGNHLHNMKVIKHKEGELLLPRRRLGKFNLSEYGPCPSCKEWMVLNASITNHQKSCPAKLETEYHKGSTIIQVGIITGKVQHTGSKNLWKEVIPCMKKDSITEIAVADPLILSLGDIWFMKNVDNKRKRKYYASFHMRLAARLLSAFQKDCKDCTISDMLAPGSFDKVAEVALEICSNDMGQSGELQHPSTAVKIGFDIMRLASSKLGMAVRQGEKIMKSETKEFIYLMNKEWSVKVNKLARSTLSERQFNRKKELPHPEDIVTFSTYLVKQLQSLDLDPTAADGVKFRQTAMLVEARLMLYNRRRPGELEALSLESYRNRSTTVSDTDLSLRSQLSELEKKMLQSQELVEIRGKNGTRVPVICPKEVIPSMKYLADKEVRKRALIKEGNPYLFANSAGDVVRAGCSLEELRTECGSLKFPDRIHATNLRKHCATIAQVIGLKDHEIQYLCKHLGHTLRVHETHYRSTSGLVERLDIAKLMLIQEGNLVGKFTGKPLNDITFEEILHNEEMQDPETVTEDFPVMNRDMVDMVDIVDDDDGDTLLSKRKKPKKSTRKTWTKSEEEELKKLLPEYFNGKNKKTCPSRHECLEAIQRSREQRGVLHLRTWEIIKKKINNMLLRRN